MTKSELIEKIAISQDQLPPRDVEQAVRMILERMTKALVGKQRIEIRGFGSFSLHYRAPRIGRNPKTGESVGLSGKYVPHFKPGKELRDRVNATYGYNAIARIRITQTAATGFAEAQAHFAGATHNTQQAEAPETGAQARQMVDRVGNADLRAALESLGRNVLTKQHSNKKGTT